MCTNNTISQITIANTSFKVYDAAIIENYRSSYLLNNFYYNTGYDINVPNTPEDTENGSVPTDWECLIEKFGPDHNISDNSAYTLNTVDVCILASAFARWSTSTTGYRSLLLCTIDEEYDLRPTPSNFFADATLDKEFNGLVTCGIPPTTSNNFYQEVTGVLRSRRDAYKKITVYGAQHSNSSSVAVHSAKAWGLWFTKGSYLINNN